MILFFSSALIITYINISILHRYILFKEVEYRLHLDLYFLTNKSTLLSLKRIAYYTTELIKDFYIELFFHIIVKQFRKSGDEPSLGMIKQ